MHIRHLLFFLPELKTHLGLVLLFREMAWGKKDGAWNFAVTTTVDSSKRGGCRTEEYLLLLFVSFIWNT